MQSVGIKFHFQGFGIHHHHSIGAFKPTVKLLEGAKLIIKARKGISFFVHSNFLCQKKKQTAETSGSFIGLRRKTRGSLGLLKSYAISSVHSTGQTGAQCIFLKDRPKRLSYFDLVFFVFPRIDKWDGVTLLLIGSQNRR